VNRPTHRGSPQPQFEDIERALPHALLLVGDVQKAYLSAPAHVRRLLHQALFVQGGSVQDGFGIVAGRAPRH
jgi:hypothetical protein